MNPNLAITTTILETIPPIHYFFKRLGLIFIYAYTDFLVKSLSTLLRYGTSVQSVKDVAAQGKYIFLNTDEKHIWNPNSFLKF